MPCELHPRSFWCLYRGTRCLGCRIRGSLAVLFVRAHRCGKGVCVCRHATSWVRSKFRIAQTIRSCCKALLGQCRADCETREPVDRAAELRAYELGECRIGSGVLEKVFCF